MNGRKIVIELLLATGGVDPDFKDKYDRALILVAARNE